MKYTQSQVEVVQAFMTGEKIQIQDDDYDWQDVPSYWDLNELVEVVAEHAWKLKDSK